MAAPAREATETAGHPERRLRRDAAAIAGLVVLMAVCWVPAMVGGGAAHLPPLWPFLPIVLAAFRFGLPGAISAATAGGFVAGPLTPADVPGNVPQAPGDWLTRAGFFLAMAVILGLAVGRLRRESRGHLDARERLATNTAELEADVAERKQLEQRLRLLAFRDTLTGLANRALLQEHLAAALARARRAELGVALVYIDLNDFKLVNDSLGHASGDRLLCEVARRLERAARDGDLVARHGGDEFLVMVPDIGVRPDKRPDFARCVRSVPTWLCGPGS